MNWIEASGLHVLEAPSFQSRVSSLENLLRESRAANREPRHRSELLRCPPMLAALLTLALSFLYDAPTAAHDSLQESATEIGGQLLRDPAVSAALERIKRDEPQVLADQVRLCEI